MVKVMTEVAFNEAMENVKNQVIADLAENLKDQLTQKLGKYTTLNMNGGVVAVAIDDEGLIKDILDGLSSMNDLVELERG